MFAAPICSARQAGSQVLITSSRKLNDMIATFGGEAPRVTEHIPLGLAKEQRETEVLN